MAKQHPLRGLALVGAGVAFLLVGRVAHDPVTLQFEGAQAALAAGGEGVLTGTLLEAEGPTRSGLAAWVEQNYVRATRRGRWEVSPGTAGIGRGVLQLPDGERDVRFLPPLDYVEGLSSLEEETEDRRLYGVSTGDALTLLKDRDSADLWTAYRGSPEAVGQALATAIRARKLRGWIMQGFGGLLVLLGLGAWVAGRRSPPSP